MSDDGVRQLRDQVAAMLQDRKSLKAHADRLFANADKRRAGVLRFEDFATVLCNFVSHSDGCRFLHPSTLNWDMNDRLSPRFSNVHIDTVNLCRPFNIG